MTPNPHASHHRLAALLQAVLFLAAGVCSAEDPGRPATGAAGDASARPRAAIGEFFVAAQAYDWARVASLLADDFMFYGDDAIVLDRDGFLSAMEQDEMRIESLELSDVESFLSDDNTLAFVRYSLALRSWIDGRRHDVQTVETVILRRTDNASAEWQLVQNHASLKPL